MTSRAACPALLLLILALAVSPAQANPASAEHSLDHAADAGWVAAALLALWGLTILGKRRNGTRGYVLSLALLVGLFGVESAVHSVHHLGDPEGAESCAVFSVAQNVPVMGGQSPDVGEPIWRPEIFRFDEGRSPPRLLSA
jgi:hypothetical protein